MKRPLLVLAGLFVGACSWPDCNRVEPDSVPARAWEHAGESLNGAGCKGDDESEPNESVSQRNELVSATCGGTGLVRGKVADDVDAFHVRASRCDGLLRASLDVGAQVRFCLFATCKRGTTALVKTDDAAADQGEAMYTPEGVRGRCRTGPGGVIVRLDCAGDGSGARESEVDAFLVVDHTTDCTPYTFSYRF